MIVVVTGGSDVFVKFILEFQKIFYKHGIKNALYEKHLHIDNFPIHMFHFKTIGPPYEHLPIEFKRQYPEFVGTNHNKFLFTEGNVFDYKMSESMAEVEIV